MDEGHYQVDLPRTVSSSVFALRFGPATGSEEEWLVLDPSEPPRDGSLVLAATGDGRRLLCRVFSFGSSRRYMCTSGEEISDPGVAGVVKVRLSYVRSHS